MTTKKHLDGLGGVFICSNDPARLAAWYAETLGFEFSTDAGPTTFYTMFQALALDDPSRVVDTTFSIMRAKQPLPVRAIPAEEPDDMYGDQPCMLNLKVRDLEGFIAALAERDVPVIKQESYSFGSFAWIRDADGNRIELYEPAQLRGPRMLRKEVVVKASRAEVWRRWTTPEGLASFFSPRCRVELRAGGPFEMLFIEDAPEGSQGSEGCQIVSFEPEACLVFTWNFPPSLPEIRDARTCVTLTLRDGLEGHTAVTLTQVGWRSGEMWDEGFAYFESAWSRVLENLKGALEEA